MHILLTSRSSRFTGSVRFVPGDLASTVRWFGFVSGDVIIPWFISCLLHGKMKRRFLCQRTEPFTSQSLDDHPAKFCVFSPSDPEKTSAFFARDWKIS